MKATCVFKKHYDHYVEVTKNVSFNVICLYFRQAFIKNLHKVRLLWWGIDCTYYCWFSVWSKNMFSVFLEKYDLTL